MPGPESDNLRNRLARLPKIDAVLARPFIQSQIDKHGRAAVTDAARAVTADFRRRLLAGEQLDPGDEAAFDAALNSALLPTLRPVINATGVLIHTNLGRAPLAPMAVQAIAEIAAGYCSVEYDLDAGRRGDRHGHPVALLQALCGAEDAVVVNNCAAAVMLALKALADDQEVIVSRGELVEIGGGFRVPDVMRASGAHLVEVGTTNKTRIADYEAAITDRTGMLLKVHKSNFAVVGFTEEASVAELKRLGEARGIPCVIDAGAGLMIDMTVAPTERPVARLLRDGADLVAFSGDKMLGGPQAGILVGKRDIVDRCRRHPLMRALRPDKVTLAALMTTLRLWRDRPEAIPVFRFLTRPEPAKADLAELLRRTLGKIPAVDARVESTVGTIGGGASPLATVPSRAVSCQVPDLDDVQRRLRQRTPSVIGRVENDRLFFDILCLEETDIATIGLALGEALEQVRQNISEDGSS